MGDRCGIGEECRYPGGDCAECWAFVTSLRGPLGGEVWCDRSVELVRSRHPGQIDMLVVSTRRKQEGEYASSLHASQARYGLAGRPHPQQQSTAGAEVGPGEPDAGRRCLAQGPHT
jgi:hypothetical protein